MTDITVRLRKLYIDHGTNHVSEAADTIEKLRSKLAKLEAQPVQTANLACYQQLYALREIIEDMHTQAINHMFIKSSALEALAQEIGCVYKSLKNAIEQPVAWFQPARRVLENDVERMRWLAENPACAIDIFGRVHPGEVRFLRLFIDAAMVAHDIKETK